MSELSRKELTYKRADEARPRNSQRFPFAEGPSVGACIDAYHEEHRHRRKASTYYVTETLNQFLAANDIEENFPIVCLEKHHYKVYKTALLNCSIMRRLLGHAVGKSVEARVYLGSLSYSVKELSEALETVKFPMA